MGFINTNIKWIMLITGLVTCTMLFAVIAPQAAIQATFGESISGPLADMLVRSWGFLITIMGLLLIYGAYRPLYRKLILVVVGAGKLFFVCLIVVYGYIQPAMSTLVFDSLVVLIYILYLTTSPKQA